MNPFKIVLAVLLIAFVSSPCIYLLIKSKSDSTTTHRLHLKELCEVQDGHFFRSAETDEFVCMSVYAVLWQRP